MRSPGDSFGSTLSATVFAVGAVLFISGAIGTVLDTVPAAPVTGLGMPIDVDLELLGIVTVVGAVLGDRTNHRPSAAPDTRLQHEEQWTAYITRSLFETLQQFAIQSDPESLSIGLAVTPARRLTGGDEIPGELPVFTHLYLPNQPNSVSSVFGVDLHTPPGRTHGRFVTHPFSELRLTKRDDLHEVVFVAVPPWDEDSIAAFDRAGRRHPIRVVDAVPPDEPLPQVDQ